MLNKSFQSTGNFTCYRANCMRIKPGKHFFKKWAYSVGEEAEIPQLRLRSSMRNWNECCERTKSRKMRERDYNLAHDSSYRYARSRSQAGNIRSGFVRDFSREMEAICPLRLACTRSLYNWDKRMCFRQSDFRLTRQREDHHREPTRSAVNSVRSNSGLYANFMTTSN